MNQKRVALLERWFQEPYDALPDRSDGAEYASYRARAPSAEITAGYVWREFPKTAYLFSLAHYPKADYAENLCRRTLHTMALRGGSSVQGEDNSLLCNVLCSNVTAHSAG